MKRLIVFFIIISALNLVSCIITKKGPISRSFYTHKAIKVGEKECVCIKNTKCSCCESVNILDIRSKKNLCLHITSDINGLKANISLDSTVLHFAVINSTRTSKLCTAIPGDIFSKTCAEIDVKFNSRYATICSKINFLSRYEKLQTKFGCANITSEVKKPENVHNYLVQNAFKYPIQQYAGHYLYTESTGPSTVKIQFVKNPQKTSSSSTNDNKTGPSSTAQIVEGQSFTTSKAPMTHISIEISPSDITPALSANEQNPLDQISVAQYPIGQILMGPYTIRRPQSNQTAVQITDKVMKNGTLGTILLGQNISGPGGRPIISVLENSTNENSQKPITNSSPSTSSKIVFLNDNQKKTNYTTNDHLKLIGLTHMSDIKEIKRFSEVTVSTLMDHNNQTTFNHQVFKDMKNRNDKDKDKRKKIRFPDGSSVRRIKYKPKSTAIVNGDLLRNINSQYFPVVTKSANSNTLHSYDNSALLPSFASFPNAILPFNGPSDLTTPRSIEVTTCTNDHDRSTRFPSRTPPVIEDYLKEVEELETPKPGVPLNPFSKIIARY